MAASVRIPVPENTWTLIAEGPLTDCLVTPTKQGFYVYSAASPGGLVESGHAIGQFENVNAVPEENVDFWFLCPSGSCSVWKTERAT